MKVSPEAFGSPRQDQSAFRGVTEHLRPRQHSSHPGKLVGNRALNKI